MARLDKGFRIERQGCFQPDDPEGRLVEFQFLFFARVGGVIGGEAFDGAIDDAADAGVDVSFRPEGRVHFGVCVVAAVERSAGFVGQQQVMRGDFRGHGFAVALGVADEFDRAGGGNVLHVVAGADAFVQQQVAGDHQFFGGSRKATEAEFHRGRACIHRSTGETVLLAVLREDAAEHFYVLECLEHYCCGVDADAIVGEANGPGCTTIAISASSAPSAPS